MHELSLVMGIVNTCEDIAKKNNAQQIEEIHLQIGTMAGVEMNAFDMAWKECIKRTLLQQAKLKIDQIAAQARCMDCNHVFSIAQLFDPCPLCKSHFVEIIQGKELKIKSILI